MRIFYQFSAKVQNNGLFSAKFAIFVPEQTLYYMNEVERIYQLRDELHRHNYNYYVLNAPEIGDQEFDFLMRELQDYRMLIYSIVLIGIMLFNWAPKARLFREKYSLKRLLKKDN